jgi:hypothetical protein
MGGQRIPTLPPNTSWADVEDVEQDEPAAGTPPLDTLPLADQAERLLNLDVSIDDFWERLRKGYAHDPAFAAPDGTYRFDDKLQLYIKDARIVVPDYDYLRRQIMLWHHTHPWHAHMGISRTASLLQRAFYWPNMHRDISQFVSQCHSCQTNKSPGVSPAAISPLPIPDACWRVVGLDQITQLPRTTAGYDNVVVFVDHFSKMVRLVPALNTLDQHGFAQLFFTHVYPHYGLPMGLVSDRGSVWNNDFFRSLCDRLGISLNLTYSYHPRANGQVERLNRVVEEAVRHFVGPAQDDWDELLPHLEFAINNAPAAATGCSPFMLNRLTPPLSPTDIALGLPDLQHPDQSAATLHRLYYHLAKKSLAEAKQSMWSACNPQADAKLLPRFAPGGIVGRHSARVALAESLRSTGIHDVFHFSVLKHYNQSVHGEPAHSALEPATAPGAPVPLAEVDSVTDVSTRGHAVTRERVPHFRVRWIGFGPDHDEWTPVDALSGCLEKVSDFLFHSCTPSRRRRLIARFPSADRDVLLDLLGRAGRTRRPVGEESTAQPYTGKVTRARARNTKAKSKPIKYAVSACSACGRMFASPSAHA